ASLPALGPGGYTVHWRILSVDGHVSDGRFSFELAERR
ncbi:MAG: copper resistance protein CopC, partial [Candidatus Rokubacteria bacterium]|nr:copper resistance protein CopC [Candidatus Rokubacteria bacterium]